VDFSVWVQAMKQAIPPTILFLLLVYISFQLSSLNSHLTRIEEYTERTWREVGRLYDLVEKRQVTPGRSRDQP
jgi:hypothetical protein